jgi:hypothetical protein
MKLHYNNFKVDLQKYNKVKSLSCDLFIGDPSKHVLMPETELKKMKDIREKALENYKEELIKTEYTI